MAVNVAQFEFTANTSTGVQTIASGLGFTPTGYIIWSSLNTSNATYQENAAMFLGFSDGTTTLSKNFVDEDNSGTSDVQHYFANDFRFATLVNPGLTPDAVASHSSFGSGTIAINWTDAPTAAYKFYGLAFGGDIACEARQFTVDTSATGNRSYTTTMSNPQLGFFMPTDSINALPGSATGGLFSLGVAVSSTKRAVLANTSENSQATMDTWSLVDNTVCMATLDANSGALESKADFVSWDANGFTLNYTDAPASTSRRFMGFFLKGANFDLGTVAKRTSTGTTTVNPSSVGTVKGIMLFSGNNQVSTSVQSHNRISIGAASSTSLQGGCWTGSKDNSANAETAIRSEDSNILIMATEHATATSSTTEAIAAISAIGTDTFTLNYTTATATAADIIWLAVGESASTTPVSQTRTHKYNILSKVTQSKVHVYNIIGKVVQTKTHKYNLLNYISQSKTHKYNVLKLITRDKTHLYNIIGKVVATRTYKYNIISIVSTTKTHLYDILALTQVSTTKTHKYNIQTSVSTTKSHLYNIISKLTVTKTHKYSLLNTVSTTKTHKFSILTSLSTNKTHKYNILELVVKAAVHVYNVIGFVTVTKTHKYDVEGKVTANKTHLYNILQSVSTSKTHEYNIVNAVTTTKTHIFSILQAAATTTTHLYNIIGYITKTKTHVYNVIGKITTSKTHKYDVIGKITLETTHKYNIISPVAAVSKTHKYDIESDTTVQRNRTHKFNILQGVTTSKTHIFSIVEAVSTIKTHVFNVIEQITANKTHKFNVIAEVEAQKTHAFSVLESVTTNKTHIYEIKHKIVTTKTHKYNIIGKIVVTKTHIFDVDSAVSAVSTTKTHKFDVEAATTEVSTEKTHIFSILEAISTTKTHEYNILEGITQSTTHKFSVIEQITQTKTHKYNIIGKLQLTKIHIFQIITRVPTRTLTHKYNIVNLVGPLTKTHKYDVIGRITTTKTHRYGLGGKVVSQKTHKYLMGADIFREFGGSTHALIRFPERVQILDILGDINNKVIANIEILPVLNNIAIGTVQISEDYPFNILTASTQTHKPKHRIASTLILPTIIDTIENRAICQYIGIQELELQSQPQFQIRSQLRLSEGLNTKVFLTGQTQIKQTEESIIKISAATLLKENDKVMNTASIMIPPNLLLNKIIIPEIMSLEKERTIKTIIKLLKTDDLFE